MAGRVRVSDERTPFAATNDSYKSRFVEQQTSLLQRRAETNDLTRERSRSTSENGAAAAAASSGVSATTVRGMAWVVSSRVAVT